MSNGVGGGASSYLLPLTAIVKFNTRIVSFPSVVIKNFTLL